MTQQEILVVNTEAKYRTTQLADWPPNRGMHPSVWKEVIPQTDGATYLFRGVVDMWRDEDTWRAKEVFCLVELSSRDTRERDIALMVWPGEVTEDEILEPVGEWWPVAFKDGAMVLV